MNHTLTILLYTSLAAAAAGLGALPLRGRKRVPLRWLGWANAIAAGLMFGAAYALLLTGLELQPTLMTMGALAGAAFVSWSHAFSGTTELELNQLDESSGEYGYQVVTVQTLHSGSEGVAIGAAAIIDIRLGVLLALTFGVHNVAEGVVLCSILRSRGVDLVRAATLAVMTNGSQVLMAVATYAVFASAPSVLPLVIGFGAGSMVYLALVELLPEAYEQAGPASIGLLTSLVIGVMALLQGAFL